LDVVLLTDAISGPDHTGIVSKKYRGDSFLLNAAYGTTGWSKVTEVIILALVSWRDFIFNSKRGSVCVCFEGLLEPCHATL
jgi:hypothetical protein